MHQIVHNYSEFRTLKTLQLKALGIIIIFLISIMGISACGGGKSISGLTEAKNLYTDNEPSITHGQSGPADNSEKADSKAIIQKAMKLQMPFIANEGQMAKEVSFYAKTFGGTAYVTQKGEMVYSFSMPDPENKPPDSISTHENIKRMALKETLVGASVKSLEGDDLSQTKVNYFIGNDKSKWKTNISTYNSVSLGEVYKGIDLSLKAFGKTVEKVFTVAPGADPKAIRLKMEGAKSLGINEKGELVLETDLGEVLFSEPIAYQEKDGKQIKVQVAYYVDNDNYGFRVDNYDKSSQLVIDPVLSYSSYVGGSDMEEGYDIAVDTSGNAYMTGVTQSPDFPGDLVPDGPGGYRDVFVTKIDFTGIHSYTSYFGGDDADSGLAIAVNDIGSVYVAGLTKSNNFPISTVSYQGVHGGGPNGRDGFITRLNSEGDSIEYSTYLGGQGDDHVQGITLYADKIYVTGSTGNKSSNDFPTKNAYIGVWNDSTMGSFVAFVTVIDPAQINPADQLVYSTYLGGQLYDEGMDITVDASNEPYVAITGSTQSVNFPTRNSYQSFTGPWLDAFVAIIDPAETGDSSLIYSTYLGGNHEDKGQGIAVDVSGYVYLTGYTKSNNFPTTADAFEVDEDGEGTSDAFVAIIDPKETGTNQLIYSTYIGGTGIDEGEDIVLDSDGLINITGRTTSVDFDTASPIHNHAGDWDTFITKIDRSKSGNAQLVFSTYLGGSHIDRGLGIDVSPSGTLYVTGYTWSGNFPTTLNAIQPDFGGGFQDAFVAKIGPDTDGDGMDDNWEVDHFGNLSNNGTGDTDLDGLTDLEEFENNTDPKEPDTDGDGLNDGNEINTYGTDPLSSETTGGAIPDIERAALIDLYNSTNGPGWTTSTNWSGFVLGTECTWFGVSCTGNHVTEIDLGSNQLTGTIPDLSALTSLRYLWLSSNQLTGTIPDLSALTSLQYLYLYSNQLTGAIPDLSALISLAALDLSFNQLTGTIPDLSALTSLWSLFLTGNQLTGTIPDLSALTSLQFLLLNINQLTGTIPDLSTLISLKTLYLNNNQLTGTIPKEFGNFVNLQYLYLNNNQLMGTIPQELGNLGNLQQLLLNSNQLSGPIPISLKNLTNLEENGSDFRWNALYVEEPADPDLIDLLTYAQVDDDWEITQTIAPDDLTVGTVTNTSVELTWTPILYTGDTGGYEVYYSISSGGPYELFETKVDKSATTSTITGLTPGTDYYFVVQTVTDDHTYNQNTVHSGYTAEVPATTTTAPADTDGDGMPDDWETAHGFDPNSDDSALNPDNDGLSNLEEYQHNTDPNNSDTDGDSLFDGDEVNVYGTDPLSSETTGGAIPDVERAALIDLYNSTNGPGWTTSTNWSGFVLGTECTWFGVACDGNNVASIGLSFNNLAGSIPSTIGTLSSLNHLGLNDNQLSGIIPVEIGNLSNLNNLSLYNNQLSGTIPVEIGNLSNLMYLYLDGNQLSGSIPSELGTLSSLVELHLFMNQLSGAIPVEIGSLSSLWDLLLDGNQFSGSIPKEIGNLTNLHYINLGGNLLSGTIPSELGNLSNLEGLYLHHNQLSGSIPPELGNLSNLWQLLLNNNQLSGAIPSSFISLTSLTNNESDFCNNTLYTDDQDLRDFLNTKQVGNDWEGCQTFSDTDGDGMPDDWESDHGLNPTDPADAYQDPDGDGLWNLNEYQNSTDPFNADTDGDKISDGYEVGQGTDPIDSSSFPPLPLNWGSVMNVHESDGSFATYLEVLVGNGFIGTLPDDITSIFVSVPSGATAVPAYPGPDWTYYPQWRDFFVKVDGSPTIGTYTFTVNSGSLSGTAMDGQTENITLPIPNTPTFTQADGGALSSKTPTFTWNPVTPPEGTTIYYRLDIAEEDNGQPGTYVYQTGQIENMLSFTFSNNVLNPGQSYMGRVRANDRGSYVEIQNRSQSDWITFTVERDPKRLYWFDVSVYDAHPSPNRLKTMFSVLPGFRNKLTSAVLRIPNSSRIEYPEYMFDLFNDRILWDTECRYADMLLKDSGEVQANDYGEYTLTLNFSDGAREVYTETLQEVSPQLTAVAGINVTVNDDGSAHVIWDRQTTDYYYYEVRVRDSEIEYCCVGPFLNATEAYLSAYDLRCLKKGETYRWLVRVLDEPFPNSNAAQTEEISAQYSPASLRHMDLYHPNAWDGALNFLVDTRSGSRDQVESITVAGPNSFSYEFDLTGDWRDLSSETRLDFKTWWAINSGWALTSGDYTFTINYDWNGDTLIDLTEEFTKHLDLSVSVTAADNLNSVIHDSGAMTFSWDLPTGVTGQYYEIRVRSADGSKEYYKSPRLYDGNQVTASYWELRAMEHGKTYQWFVRAYDFGANITKQSIQTLTFVYNPFDADNDGYFDLYDAFPDDPTEWLDTDSDGLGNNADPDDDDDGLSDVDEINIYGTDPLNSETEGGAIPDVERAALIDLYNSTGRDNWTNKTNWLGDVGTECTWYGVICTENNVGAIYLDSNNLAGPIPPRLGSLTNLGTLNLSNNQLTGSIPVELGNLTNLQSLSLGDNQFIGNIPAELGSLSNLNALRLASNQLTGPIPTSLTNLTNLSTTGIDFRWNGLYTTDITLRDFLNSKQSGGDWESTQTIAPEDLAVDTLNITDTSVTLIWEPITYIADGGGYEVYYSELSGGPYDLFETTVDKSATTSTVTGLTPSTDYYFIVQTKTDSHTNNLNTVQSGYTDEVSATTLPSDTEKPTVSSVTLNPPSPVKAGPVTFTITFSEDLEQTVPPTVLFGTPTPDRTIAGSYTDSTTWQGTYTIETGYDGLQTISISGAKDLAGNEMNPDTSHTFWVDTTAPGAPDVTGITPTSDTTPTWTWSSGGGNGTFRYKLDDSDLTTGATETTATAFTPASELSEGSHTLYVQEKDDADNWSDSGSFTIVIDTTPVDTTPPVITLLGDNPMDVGFGSTYTDLGATATDDVDGDLTTSILVGGDTVNTSVIGNYIITYNVSDAAGNPAIQVTRTVNVVDNTPPSDPEILSAVPPINTPTNDDTVDLDWQQGSDTGSGVNGYSWLVDRVSNTLPDELIEPDLPSTINLSSGDGDYYIHVRTKDNAGNWTNTYHYGPWQLDQTPPGFPLVDGLAATNDRTPDYTWSTGGQGNGNYRYQLNSEDPESWSDETLATAYTPASDLPEDSHTLYVQERDEAGNWSVSGSFTTTVDTTAPVSPAQGHDPVDGQINVAVGTNISVNVQDAGSGVNPETVVMKVEGTVVYDGASPSSYPDTTFTGTAYDFILTYDPPNSFDYEQEVNITVDASDLAGNPMIQENYSFITEPKTGNPWDPEGDDDEDDIPNEVEQLLGTNPDVKTLFVRPKKESGGYWEEFIQLFPDTKNGFADVPPFTHAGIEISVIGDSGNPYVPMRDFNYDPAQDTNHPNCDILEIVYREGIDPITEMPSYCKDGNNNYGHTYFSSIARTWYWDTKGYVPNNTASLHYQQYRYFTADIYPFTVDNYVSEGAYPSIQNGQTPEETTCPLRQCYDTSLSSTMNLNATDPVSGRPDGTVEFNVITFDYQKKITFVGTTGGEYDRDTVLKRTIAHEMGHAILAASSSDHCSDKQCIMSGSSVDWEMHDFGPGNCSHSPGGAKDIRARGVIHNSRH